MLVAAITGQRQASLIEKPTPQAKDDLVVVRIHATPMCTEYKAYANGRPIDNLGHEAVGEVIEVAHYRTCTAAWPAVAWAPLSGRCRRCE